MALSRGNKSQRSLLERSTVLEELDSPPTARAAIWFGAVLLFLFVLWTAFAVVEEVAQAPGALGSEGDETRVQHPTGGVVTAVLVKEGELVRAGTPILRLDPLNSETAVAQTRAQRVSLVAQTVRLRALIEGRRPVFASGRDADANVASDQERLWRMETRTAAAEEEVLVLQESQKKAELDSLENQISNSARQLALAREELTIRQGLAEKGVEARTNALGSSRVVAGLEAELARLPVEKRRVEAELAEIGARRLQAASQRMKAWSDDLAALNDRIAQLDEAVRSLEHGARGLEVLAPVDGAIHGLVFTSPGEVVRAGETIAQVVPKVRTPKAELHVAPKDIGAVQPGMPVRLKISAWPFDRYGGFRGSVSEISASTFVGPDGSPYYRVVAVVEGRELAGAADLDLLPGMTLTADIITGERTILQYLMKPLFASAREAFRER